MIDNTVYQKKLGGTNMPLSTILKFLSGKSDAGVPDSRPSSNVIVEAQECPQKEEIHSIKDIFKYVVSNNTSDNTEILTLLRSDKKNIKKVTNDLKQLSGDMLTLLIADPIFKGLIEGMLGEEMASLSIYSNIIDNIEYIEKQLG